MVKVYKTNHEWHIAALARRLGLNTFITGFTNSKPHKLTIGLYAINENEDSLYRLAAITNCIIVQYTIDDNHTKWLFIPTSQHDILDEFAGLDHYADKKTLD